MKEKEKPGRFVNVEKTSHARDESTDERISDSRETTRKYTFK